MSETASAAVTFPFSRLPLELQLKIIESIDLSFPDGVIWWDRRYRLHKADQMFESIPCSHILSPLLVNKFFYLKVRQLFWSQNCFTISPPRSDWAFPPTTPIKDFAATLFFVSFLRNKLPLDMLRHVRSIYICEFLSFVNGPVGEACRRWYDSLQYAKTQGGLNLDFIYIESEFGWIGGASRETLETTPAPDIAKVMRESISNHVWPLPNGNKPTPALTQQLLVMVGRPGVRVWYSIRRKGHTIPLRFADKSRGGKDNGGTFCGTRVIRVDSVPKNATGWATQTQPGTWIEETWVKFSEPGAY